MKTANRTKPKTDFGIEVRVFTAQTGMTVKELAERAGGGLRRHRHLLAFRGCYVPRGHPRRQGNLALHISGRLSLDDVQ